MKIIEVLYAGTFRAAEIVLALIALALLGAVSVSVFYRYVLNDSLAWGDELPSMLLVWLTFLGAAVITRDNENLNFDGVVKLLPMLGQRICAAFNAVLILIFLGYMTWHGWLIADQSWARNAITIPVSMGIVRLIVPISGALMMLVYALDLIRILSGGNLKTSGVDEL